jgi:uncharacterized protein (TIGR03435 family)
MRIATLAVMAVALAVATAEVGTSAASQSTPAASTYDVVSIKKNTGTFLGSNGSNERPDGGFTLLNVPVGTLISRAYPGHPPVDMVNLPGWAMSERYDVSATSPLSSATPDQRSAMMRAMLADRLKLAAHFENRDQPVYDLILARADKRLGPTIKPSEVDCIARDAAERAALQAATAAGTVPPRPAPPPFDPRASAPPCTRRRLGTGWEGDFTMAMLAQLLRGDAGRLVIDKTGVTGSYRLSLTFERSASGRGPDIAPSADALPSVFIAVQEQLGLKLEPSRVSRETLIIDRLERPTEN